MTKSVEAESKQGLGKHRIEALSDGIFAIAMTLLILDVKIPKIAEASLTPGFLPHVLLGLWPKFLTFAVSFVILGLFWIAHHGYSHFLTKTDRYFLWINLLFLMVVVFVPFSTNFLGDYPQHRASAMLYGCNIMMLGVMLHWQWEYATTKFRLVGSHMEPQFVRQGKMRIRMGILANFVAVLLALVNPLISLALYILFPFVYIMPSHIDRHWTHSHD